MSIQSIAVKLPSHPTYNLKGVIKLALAEDAGDRGDVTCMATIPVDMEVEAHFVAKEDGVIAGIALEDMVFSEVDPTLKVETRTLEEVIEVLQYASQAKTFLTRIMLDNMVVPQPNGDVDVSMLKEAVGLINGRFGTERCTDAFREGTPHFPENRYRACT
ncbi:Nicotinate-nucleotide pyrophosphorylase [Actinidia chinensis var. chinensis]|uniref:Nicotinate-nucleotide pyrophosphorylase n=1 Tax=Actinidia chinensis var. chinensis TaxID=1590841 RepID=A0A2R6PGU2_ACTCC|nr:Nicotinate-nucleotide pyrophosphorylase [Actinidia chinensis var. chinensis]